MIEGDALPACVALGDADWLAVELAEPESVTLGVGAALLVPD